MSDKKFANLHYPGMKADPNEGGSPLPPEIEWRFQDQIENLGIDHQKKMHISAALLLDASPLALKIAKKAALVGLGSVGVLGDTNTTSAFEIATKDDLAKPALQNLREWSKREAPWARIETFKELSVERRFEDIEKGFGCFVLCSPAAIQAYAKEIVPLKKDTFFAFLSGSKALIGMIPKENISADALQSLHSRASVFANIKGTNLALLDWTAARVSILLQDYFTLGKRSQTFLDMTDATVSPWKTESLTL